jgi:hypothetical protein
MSELTQSDLSEFTGTLQYYRNALTGITYTDGVHFLAAKAECYWLIDTIGSYYRTLIKPNEELDIFCLWELTIDGTKAMLICKADSDTEPVITQEIEYTDFAEHCDINPLKLYQCSGVLLLPSEY